MHQCHSAGMLYHQVTLQVSPQLQALETVKNYFFWENFQLIQENTAALTVVSAAFLSMHSVFYA